MLLADRAERCGDGRTVGFRRVATAWAALRTAVEDDLGGSPVEEGDVPNRIDPTAGGQAEIDNGMAMLVRAGEVFMHAAEQATCDELAEFGIALWAASGRLHQVLPAIGEHLDAPVANYSAVVARAHSASEELLDPDLPPPVDWPISSRPGTE